MLNSDFMKNKRRSRRKSGRFFRRVGFLAGILLLIGIPVFFFRNQFEEKTPETKTYTDEELHTIMGDTVVSASQMTGLFEKKGVSFPAEIMAKGGAGSIDEFCRILLEEAQAEGVRGEVVFAQSMLETGWLQFGGDTSPEQYNFSGLGATGNGEPGISFPDVRTGLRAQVQHLKAYASNEDLNQPCVDERFSLVARETAPYIEWHGIQENPYGGGWAAGEQYGHKILILLQELYEMDENRDW